MGGGGNLTTNDKNCPDPVSVAKKSSLQYENDELSKGANGSIHLVSLLSYEIGLLGRQFLILFLGVYSWENGGYHISFMVAITSLLEQWLTLYMISPPHVTPLMLLLPLPHVTP